MLHSFHILVTNCGLTHRLLSTDNKRVSESHVLHTTDSNKSMRTCSVSRQLLGGCSPPMHALGWKASPIIILMAGSMAGRLSP
jgi:hypothetical protein